MSNELAEELNCVPFIDLLGQITLQTIDIQSSFLFTETISEASLGIQDHLKSVYDEMCIFFCPFKILTEIKDVKSIITSLLNLHVRHPELCLNIEHVLHAATYFAFDRIYH